MALDYQVSYGPLAYNLIVKFRRDEPAPMVDAEPIEAAHGARWASDGLVEAARAA
jgi:hypothetical protein